MEASVEIFLNNHSLARLRCTPCHVADLARGFLLTEGWVDDAQQILSVRHDPAQSRVHARIDVPEGDIERIRGRLSVASGCGGGLSRDDLTLDPDCKKKFDLIATIDEEQIRRLAEQFEKRSSLYRETRCVHSAGIFEGEEFLSFSEDLGRHNAVDKAVGMLCEPGFSFGGKGLFTSGRATLDIVAKMARLRAAFIVSRACPSAEAVRVADQFHVAVIGRLRRTSMKIYSAPWRVKVGR